MLLMVKVTLLKRYLTHLLQLILYLTHLKREAGITTQHVTLKIARISPSTIKQRVLECKTSAYL
jgi:hypothetical protein